MVKRKNFTKFLDRNTGKGVKPCAQFLNSYTGQLFQGKEREIKQAQLMNRPECFAFRLAANCALKEISEKHW